MIETRGGLATRIGTSHGKERKKKNKGRAETRPFTREPQNVRGTRGRKPTEESKTTKHEEEKRGETGNMKTGEKKKTKKGGGPDSGEKSFQSSGQKIRARPCLKKGSAFGKKCIKFLGGPLGGGKKGGKKFPGGCGNCPGGVHNTGG